MLMMVDGSLADAVATRSAFGLDGDLLSLHIYHDVLHAVHLVQNAIDGT